MYRKMSNSYQQDKFRCVFHITFGMIQFWLGEAEVCQRLSKPIATACSKDSLYNRDHLVMRRFNC